MSFFTKKDFERISLFEKIIPLLLLLFMLPPLIHLQKSHKDYSVFKDTTFEWIFSKKYHEHSFDFDGNVRISSSDDPELNDDKKLALFNAMKIIKALKAYKVDNLTYPKTLKALVPKYLPKIPRTEFTGFWVSHDFHYEYPTIMYNDDTFELRFSAGFEDFYWWESGNVWDFEYD